jgi:hypothetical protein
MKDFLEFFKIKKNKKHPEEMLYKFNESMEESIIAMRILRDRLRNLYGNGYNSRTTITTKHNN